MNANLWLSILLAATVSFTSCSNYSKSSREQRAYANYVQKSRMARAELQSKIAQSRSALPPPQQPGNPLETIEMQPQSVSSGSAE